MAVEFLEFAVGGGCREYGIPNISYMSFRYLLSACSSRLYKMRDIKSTATFLAQQTLSFFHFPACGDNGMVIGIYLALNATLESSSSHISDRLSL